MRYGEKKLVFIESANYGVPAYMMYRELRLEINRKLVPLGFVSGVKDSYEWEFSPYTDQKVIRTNVTGYSLNALADNLIQTLQTNIS